jgi:hypothetical protein
VAKLLKQKNTNVGKGDVVIVVRDHCTVLVHFLEKRPELRKGMRRGG